MSDSWIPWNPSPTAPNRRPRLPGPWPRICAVVLLLTYAAVIVLVSVSLTRPADLGVRFQPCPDGWCVSWVIPVSHGWQQGAAPGMAVVSIDGTPAAEIRTPPPRAEESVDLRLASGNVLRIRVVPAAIGAGPWKLTIWVLGAIFALFGAVVLVRRPDHASAWLFGGFAAFTAIGLGVAPATLGPQPLWAVPVQLFTILAVAACFLGFVVTVLQPATVPRKTALALTGFFLFGGLIYATFLASIFFAPWIYRGLRPVFSGYGTVAVLGSLVFLAVQSFRGPSADHRHVARLVLSGVGLGSLPFVAFTLIPVALGYRQWMPTHFAALFWGLIPVTLAYAILRHQLLGIRRLFHRGIVYGASSVILLLLISLALAVVTSALGQSGAAGSFGVTVLVLGVGAVMFNPLVRLVRRFLGAVLYRDEVDYNRLIATMGDELTTQRRTYAVANLIASRLTEALQLESALVLVGEDLDHPRAVGMDGTRAEEVLPLLQTRIVRQANPIHGFKEIHWEANSLLFAPLIVAGRPIGHLLLGPRKAGEVFVAEEKRLIATLLPVLGMAIDKSLLSDDLRELNRRLIDSEEAERARIAQDLHDGPLQKAILLGSPNPQVIANRRDLTRQLVFDLREVCSRLRPAILDDLGLVAALEWQLEGFAKLSDLSFHLHTRNLDDDDRFASEVELALFRVMQESINNVLKHARATEVTVTLSRKDGELMLQVRDNGVGFDPSSRRQGMGVPGMRERLFALGGSLDLESSPGAGTVVAARVRLSGDRLAEPS